MGQVTALLALMGVLGGCSSDRSAAPRVDFRMDDFSIKIATPRLASGTYDLALLNIGPTVHELIVARTPLDAKLLPVASDGLGVEEHDLENVASDEFVAFGSALNHLAVTLSPGHYVVYCNLEGHYKAGMAANLEVVE